MSDVTESPSFSAKALMLAEKIFDTLWGNSGNQDAWHWGVLILVGVVCFCAAVTITSKALGNILESLVKLVDIYKASGLPMWLSSDSKSRVRRRKQFCGVLDADLAYLAKAENWNDQYFTDLEAEVETEGGYYASSWDRFWRRKSFGLRKERSLIRAINSSTERAMQLVGEPGSGKSVALRHLAKQFAEQGRKSNDKKAKVPLYVNLREMDNHYPKGVTVDDVRMFVLDNIRRGDADTSAFVRENWQDYCNKGTWLFLFDSFDEIPAVLHAETGSDVVKQYSEAIRQFLEGMGECKGILASREFKGPQALPWKKLRILPLSEEKQDELIGNSFLDESKMSLVRQHLAGTYSSIGTTPLFLTLLCRYVKDEKREPNNDHDILLQHVERLAGREPEYLWRKYKLSVGDLIVGAERLARLFAEDETLSLAPSLDQISSQLKGEQVPGGSIERLVSALVDCKIGRADVPNAAHGDRRFAFAHRRYQEALFVRYLARTPGAISATELLTEPRWREYAVTLLQTRPVEEIRDLLNVASDILKSRAGLQPAHLSEPLILHHAVFFDWKSESAVPLLSLLQEGLSRRLQDIPADLSASVQEFLTPRWTKGDTWDRCEVLRLGGLLPQDVLKNHLTEVFNFGTKLERSQAFRLATFTRSLPAHAHHFVLMMLSSQVLQLTTRAEQLNLEAVAARLPANMGANFVVNRGNQLRQNLRWITKVFSTLGISLYHSVPRGEGELASSKVFSLPKIKLNNKIILPAEVAISMVFILILSSAATLTINFASDPSLTPALLSAGVSLVAMVYLLSLCPYIVRSYGQAVTIKSSAEFLRENFKIFNFSIFLLVLALIGLAGVLIGWTLGYSADWLMSDLLGYRFFDKENPAGVQLMGLGLGIVFIAIYSFGIISVAITSLKDYQVERRRYKKLQSIKASGTSGAAALYSASSADELISWLNRDQSLLAEIGVTRGFSSFVLNAFRKVNREGAENLHGCLSSKDFHLAKINVVRGLIEDIFLKLNKD